jgi:hypothetical protein
MGRGVKIPWIGGSNTMGMRVKIPWIGGQNTMSWKFDIAWVWGVKIPWMRNLDLIEHYERSGQQYWLR